MKRILAAILSFVLLFSLTQIVSFSLDADDVILEDGLYYRILNNNTVTVFKCLRETPEIVIPDTVDGFTVASIDAEAFRGKEIKSVTIPGTVKSIGKYAFYDCNSLEKIVILEGVKSIGSYAFGSQSIFLHICPKALKALVIMA